MKPTDFKTQRHDLPLCFRPTDSEVRPLGDQAREFGEVWVERQAQVSRFRRIFVVNATVATVVTWLAADSTLVFAS